MLEPLTANDIDTIFKIKRDYCNKMVALLYYYSIETICISGCIKKLLNRVDGTVL